MNQENKISLKVLLPLLAAIMALSPLSIDMYLPAMPVIAVQLQTSMSMVQNSLSIYLLGYALGLVLFGPMADKHSRRKMVLFGISGFALTSLMLPYVSNVEQLLIIRFIQAFVCSAATVVIPGTIREFYGKHTAKGLSYVSMIMMLAPMLAPSIGSVLLLIHNWQLIFYSLFSYSIIILFLVARYLPEVNRNTNEIDVTDTNISLKELSFIARYKIVLSNKQARLDIISSMMVSLAFFGYLTAIPFVYLSVYGVSEFTFSLLFGINVIAFMTAHFINTRLVVRKGSRKMLWYGVAVSVITSSVLLMVSYWQLPLVYIVLSILPLMGSVSMIAVNSDSLILIKFPQHSGTATAVIGTLRFGIGALAGPILAYFYDGSALPFSGLMFISVLVVLVCQLITFFRLKHEKLTGLKN